MATVVTPLNLPRALAAEPAPPGGAYRSIGAILVDSGRLSAEAAERVIRHQKAHALRFGDAAVQLGLLTKEDVEQALSNQFDYAYLRADDRSVSPELVAAYQPFSATVEQLRALRSQLMLRWFDADAQRRVLGVVAPAAGSGASFIAANLAIVFAQLGEKTLLVDANLRAPRQHQLFRTGTGPGLANLLLAGQASGDPIVHLLAFPNLSVLPAGAVPPNPQELLGRPVFAELLGKLAREHDVVLVDAPAADGLADAQTIAARAGAAIMVVRRNRAPLKQVAAAAQQIREAGAVLVGTVLNDGG